MVGVVCHACAKECELNKYILVPLNSKPKLLYICTECATNILSYCLDRSDKENDKDKDKGHDKDKDKDKESCSCSCSCSCSHPCSPSSPTLTPPPTSASFPFVPLDQRKEDIKVQDVYSIIDEVFCTLINQYKLPYISIIDVITRLYLKVLTHYIHDINKSYLAMYGDIYNYYNSRRTNDNNKRMCYT